MKLKIRIALILVVFACAAFASARAGTGASAAHLTYLPDGRVVFPTKYREWPYLSSGLDMTYALGGMAMDHHMFDNVFVDPDSLRAFEATGTWPEGTVFVREDRAGATKGSINRAGQFQTAELMGLELHVKDAARFKGGWAFFFFGSNDPAHPIPENAACYKCHGAHGAVDTTFVQFYPTLIGIAKSKKTLSANYLRDER